MTPIEELELFEHIVATGSMCEAGSKLGVSAAVVSVHIRALEGRLGARLFCRPATRLELTAAGRAYFAAVILPRLKRARASSAASPASDAVVIPFRRLYARR